MGDHDQDALESALRALERKERTAAELTAWLESRGHAPDEVETTVARLIEVGELDDARFARRFAEDKRDLQRWGVARIREALAARGVESTLIESALAGESHQAQLDRAGELLARRGRPLSGEGDKARALGYLTRRGYDYEIAYEAVRLAARDAA